jgi:hypothetical protein
MEEHNYQIKPFVHDEILELSITGDLTKNDLDKLRTEIITILKKTKVRAFLWDGIIARGPTDIIDAYFRTRSVPIEVTKQIIATAIVEPLIHKEFQSFYETTAANAGISLKYFSDIETARAWLINNLEKSKQK